MNNGKMKPNLKKQSRPIKSVKPMILSPVSDWAMLNAAIDSGCDAVYLGVKNLNMRKTAKNFELNELKKVVDFCHEKNILVYLAVNSIVYEGELNHLDLILDTAKDADIDAVIAWDMAVVSKAIKKNLKVNLSTQASVSNSDACNFYLDLGINTMTLARECTLDQIKSIKKNSKIKLECFIHGAMCVAISGRCFMSKFQFGKSANRGNCLQPCRREYLIKDPETEEELIMGRDFVLSPKDLCTLPFIDKLIDSGIDIFKIEGKGRSPEYVSTVTSCYRKAVDAVFEGKFDKELIDNLMAELKSVYNRGFSNGFYMGVPLNEFTNRYGSKATKQKLFIGNVTKYYNKIGVAELIIFSNKLIVGDEILFTGKITGVHKQKVESIHNEGKSTKKAVKGDHIGVKVNSQVRVNDKVFILK